MLNSQSAGTPYNTCTISGTITYGTSASGTNSYNGHGWSSAKKTTSFGFSVVIDLKTGEYTSTNINSEKSITGNKITLGGTYGGTWNGYPYGYSTIKISSITFD